MSIVEENIYLAKDLCKFSRLCYERRLVGAAGGNLSVRIPGEELFLITASGLSLREIQMENLVVVNTEGTVVEAIAGLKPSKESSFHIAIYKAKPHVNAIIHVHPTFATVFAAARQTIPFVTVSATLKLKQGILVPDAYPGSGKLSSSIKKIVSSSGNEVSVLLLERHGILVFHEDLDRAFNDAELAEDTAKIAYYSSVGFPTLPAMNFHTAIDLSIPLNEQTPFYPTDPPFMKSWHVNYDDTGVYVSKLNFGAHLGTHVDVPLHFLKDGQGISEMPVDIFFGEAIAVDAPKSPGENITASDVNKASIRRGDIVLFFTGWERYAGTPQFFSGEWPGFTTDAVKALIDREVKAIGGDIPSADCPKGLEKGAPAHKRALSAGIPIFEALINVNKLTKKRFFFIGLPLNIERGEASPIRSIALLQE